MLSSIDFIRQSLEIHLFFVRIMKEHSFFLEIGFTPRDINFTQQADAFRVEFDRLLGEVILLSNGVVSQSVIESGEVVTPYTLNAERASSYFTGVQIQTSLTQAEIELMGGEFMMFSPALEQAVYNLNQKTMILLTALIDFKATVLSNVLSCNMFTVNYPLLIDHIMREAKLYLRMIARLQNRERINVEKEIYEQELFWNRIMAEHSKFIRGLLDPTEDALFNAANNFGKEFDQLTEDVKKTLDKAIPISKVTDESTEATKRIRDFNAQGTQGLIECKIRSIIIPLLGDHVLRESNHYLRLLRKFQQVGK
ncbi:DUF2935 domain-containing protein [Proteiniborus sp. MB09-C3]|uniref:DUF2935 domain-containing protein n=1 Tax=Proteiniborus sp. MB09-C3 TaxID=3050072 RepID=UPI002556BF85|nr:DUF2935 domain-containing protein [Proteiniborus sp. MB09-C3]WIV11504.1 DUF2935 domain-containing protein [Proteiniborus sp. MB09-C3]